MFKNWKCWFAHRWKLIDQRDILVEQVISEEHTRHFFVRVDDLECTRCGKRKEELTDKD